MGLFNRDKDRTTQQLADEISRNTAAPTGPARPINFVKQAGPATDRGVVLTKGGVDMAKRFDKAGLALSKRDLVGIRGDVEFYMDNSGSMSYDYESGLVQKLTERAAAWSANVDSDGQLPFFPWDWDVHHDRDGESAAVATLDTIDGFIDRQVYNHFPMGGTHMVTLLRFILARAKVATAPKFVFIVTDGNPTDDHDAIVELVREISHYGAWLKFLAIKPVPFLDRLDNLFQNERGNMLIDNVDAKTIKDPHGISDKDFAEAMTDELDTWWADAHTEGIAA